MRNYSRILLLHLHPDQNIHTRILGKKKAVVAKKAVAASSELRIEGFDGWLECCAILSDLKQHVSILHTRDDHQVKEETSPQLNFDSPKALLESASFPTTKMQKQGSTQQNNNSLLTWYLTCTPFLGHEFLQSATASTQMPARKGLAPNHLGENGQGECGECDDDC